MLELKSYASDLLEDAMVLAQTKAMNSFSFRDLINSLTELWGYCYERISAIDPGFYSQTIRLTEKLTRLPDCCKTVVLVYSAREQVGFSRKVYNTAGNNDMTAPFTYHISGRDIYCWDADIRPVFVEYIPVQPFVTFTKNNRDPKILWKPGDRDEDKPVPFKYIPTLDWIDADKHYHKAETLQSNSRYKMHILVGNPFTPFTPGDAPLYHDRSQYSDVTVMDGEYATQENGRMIFRSLLHGTTPDHLLDNGVLQPGGPIIGSQRPATMWIKKEGWTVTFFKLDPPYTFISYKNDITGEYESYIDRDIMHDNAQGYQWRNRYNPFDFIGRESNVEFIDAKFNDYTGMGVKILDHSDGVYKELGFTPDTLMVYPTRAMYNYMVATLAQRFAAMNGSQIMAVDLALMQAQDEIDKWLKVNKSAWQRANNVTGPTLGDFL